MLAQLQEGLSGFAEPVRTGASWTTDGPFRGTETAIAAARAHGLLAVEMEAAGLCTFALARDKRLDCLAHRDEPDGRRGRGLREGPADGPTAAPEVVAAAACILLPREGAGKPSKPSKPRESEP